MVDINLAQMVAGSFHLPISNFFFYTACIKSVENSLCGENQFAVLSADLNLSTS